MTPWPMKQSLPMLTPSQMKLWELTRVRSPTTAPRWISTKGPMKAPALTVQS
jgi:hypothetical protein